MAPLPCLAERKRGIPHFVRDGVPPHLIREGAPRMPKREVSRVARIKLEIDKKITWYDEVGLKMREGFREVFHGLKGQSI